MKSKINPRNPDTFILDKEGNMLPAKIWIGTFPNDETVRVKARNRKEAIGLLPVWGLALSCFKSFRKEAIRGAKRRLIKNGYELFRDFHSWFDSRDIFGDGFNDKKEQKERGEQMNWICKARGLCFYKSSDGICTCNTAKPELNQCPYKGEEYKPTSKKGSKADSMVAEDKMRG